jgi:hypothetical protein
MLKNMREFDMEQVPNWKKSPNQLSNELKPLRNNLLVHTLAYTHTHTHQMRDLDAPSSIRHMCFSDFIRPLLPWPSSRKISIGDVVEG